MAFFSFRDVYSDIWVDIYPIGIDISKINIELINKFPCLIFSIYIHLK